jgi:4-hydroxy-tetrahydrodipicolinate synthase
MANLESDRSEGMQLTLKGLFPSAVLPLTDDLTIAERALVVHVQRFVRHANVGGVVLNDDAGEGRALTGELQARVVEVGRSAVPEDFPILSGVWAESVDEAIERTHDLHRRGADGVLLYPPSDGIDALSFYRDVGAAVDVPLIAFQPALASGRSLATDVVAKICRTDSVVGLKTAVEDVWTSIEQYRTVDGHAAVLTSSEGPELLDVLTVRAADGAVLAASNLVPKQWGDFVEAALGGRVDEAREWHSRIGGPLAERIGARELRPASIKEALVLSGHVANSRVLPPSTDVTDEERAGAQEALGAAGLLPG